MWTIDAVCGRTCLDWSVVEFFVSTKSIKINYFKNDFWLLIYTFLIDFSVAEVLLGRLVLEGLLQVALR